MSSPPKARIHSTTRKLEDFRLLIHGRPSLQKVLQELDMIPRRGQVPLQPCILLDDASRGDLSVVSSLVSLIRAYKLSFRFSL